MATAAPRTGAALRFLGLVTLALVVIAATLYIMLPATWVTTRINDAAAGRLELSDVDGTLWSGSASLRVGSGDSGSAAFSLPGRVAWTLDPWSLLTGQLDAEITDPGVLDRAVRLKGDRTRVAVGDARIALPTGLMAHLGPPLSTLGIDGNASATWRNLVLTDGAASGSAEIDLIDARSSVSKVSPLGSYRVKIEMQGTSGSFRLDSARGPLLLSGEGRWTGREVSFRGTADAEPDYHDQLADLLGILGRPQGDGSYALRYGNG